MSINHRLFEYRKRARLSQSQLQCMCGWGPGNGRISHYEVGRVKLSVDDAKTIIRALKSVGVEITLDDLFDVPENENQKPSEYICKCCGQPIGKKAS